MSKNQESPKIGLQSQAYLNGWQELPGNRSSSKLQEQSGMSHG